MLGVRRMKCEFRLVKIASFGPVTCRGIETCAGRPAASHGPVLPIPQLVTPEPPFVPGALSRLTGIEHGRRRGRSKFSAFVADPLRFGRARAGCGPPVPAPGNALSKTRRRRDGERLNRRGARLLGCSYARVLGCSGARGARLCGRPVVRSSVVRSSGCEVVRSSVVRSCGSLSGSAAVRVRLPRRRRRGRTLRRTGSALASARRESNNLTTGQPHDRTTARPHTTALTDNRPRDGEPRSGAGRLSNFWQLADNLCIMFS